MSPRRVAVFASFNKRYRLGADARYWLQALRNVADAVVFVTDHAIAEQDEEELRRLVVHYECRRHGEYDFGSYKRGYLFLKESGLLGKADELLFCNDSCYGPMRPLEGIMADYARHPGYGVYGLTRNNEGYRYPEHVQSFFLLFPARVFRSGYFDDFMQGVRHESDKMEVVRRYEVGLSTLLGRQGEKIYTLDHMHAPYNITWFHWRRFLRKCGLVKKNLMPEWVSADTVVRTVGARYDYPLENIADASREETLAVVLKDPAASSGATIRLLDARSGGMPEAGGEAPAVCLVSPYADAGELARLLESPAGVCSPSAPTGEAFGQAVLACLQEMGVGGAKFRLGDEATVYTAAALCQELAQRESLKTPAPPMPTCACRRGMYAKWLKTRVKNTILLLMGLFCR